MSARLQDDPRALAASALNRVLLAGQSLSDFFTALPAGQGRAAAQDLAYGTLRQTGFLRFCLRRLLQRPLAPPELEGYLLVGMHELEAGQTPPHAAVHETVAAAARMAPRARGLVNAVLRNFQRQREDLATAAMRDPVAHYNLPDWWLRRLQADWPQHWQAVVEACAGHPPMTLRINRRHTTPEAALQTLRDHGLEARPQNLAEAITLECPCPVSRLPGFAAGRVSVQDLGAQWAAFLLDARDGMRVLDACAAPGGKTAHLLERNALDLLALDADAGRLARVRENLDRLGLNAELRVADAGQPQTWWDGRPFDRILLDAPCTGSGIIRRHPDARWLKREADIAQLAKAQARLLRALWPLLKPGGTFCYATCSVFKTENADQVAHFMADTPDARPRPLEIPDALDGQLLPTAEHDGFYYACLVKLPAPTAGPGRIADVRQPGLGGGRRDPP